MVWQFHWRLEGTAVFHVNLLTFLNFPSTRFSHPPIIAVRQLINSCWNIISMLVIWGKINDYLSIKMLREAVFSSPSVNLLIYSPNQLPSWTPLPPACWLRTSDSPQSPEESPWQTQGWVCLPDPGLPWITETCSLSKEKHTFRRSGAPVFLASYLVLRVNF